ncbi:peroxide stress protein YaaA [Actinosynnema sp. NPDC020468]|uniref:peroxide stress protein YaaA n=1 Tax=Actinosynnema sp. NPDC020468 TaxID=3154488 RepID=UPI0033DEB833
MLVLLPPSETKALGGDGGALDLSALSHPSLNPAREVVVGALEELARDVPASLRVLGLSERQAGEVERNVGLRVSATLPALARYTGVLYDALERTGFTKVEAARAGARLHVASALFGLVGGGDPIPAYRLSGGSVIPSVGSLGALWRPVLEPVLREVDEFVVDLRSSPYNSLAKVPDAVVVKVVTDGEGGKRQAVSHFNKAHKGRLARALVKTRAEVDSVRKLVAVAGKAGLRLEPTGTHEVELVVAGNGVG